MSLYTEWRNLSDNHESQEAEVKFWEEYLKVEAGIYNEILNNKMDVWFQGGQLCKQIIPVLLICQRISLDT